MPAHPLDDSISFLTRNTLFLLQTWKEPEEEGEDVEIIDDTDEKMVSSRPCQNIEFEQPVTRCNLPCWNYRTTWVVKKPAGLDPSQNEMQKEEEKSRGQSK